MKYVLLLRGINVGGKNKIPMVELRHELECLGFSSVSTYIASGNAIIESNQTAKEVKQRVETMLVEKFDASDDIIKVLVLTKEQLGQIITNKPSGFGEQPTVYHSDVIFMIDVSTQSAASVFRPREGVDTIWIGDTAIYSQRQSAQRTKSRLNTITQSSTYKSMTIRTWNTVIKLHALIGE